MSSDTPKSDVCLILEGSYPYVSGGVSSWVHDLICSQPEKTFSLICILAKKKHMVSKYELPENIVEIQHVYLHDMPIGETIQSKEKIKDVIEAIGGPLIEFQFKPQLDNYQKLIDQLKKYPNIGRSVLLNSPESWYSLIRMYSTIAGNTSLLNFFWSWRTLIGGIFQVSLTDYPNAEMYHSLSTGFAGLMLSRIYLEKKKPCILTEHGIYTNERRIEILCAQWLESNKSRSYDISRESKGNKNLKDFWIDTFNGISKLCYESCCEILTLHEGNKHLQIQDGADPNILRIIPNGIDSSQFESQRHPLKKPTVIALIGRVVPIKDVKTFIRAIAILKKQIPDILGKVLGPSDEDPGYYYECWELVQRLGIRDCFEFTGKVPLKEYLVHVDVNVLTSISESQPLVLLEGGAAGIPAVATDVGCCRELLHGAGFENPPLGRAGEIVELANPQSVADGIARLISDPIYFEQCQNTFQKRIQTYYEIKDQIQAYREIYDYWINQENSLSKKIDRIQEGKSGRNRISAATASQ